MGALSLAGRVVKLFGIKGELIVNLYDDFPDDFDTEEPVFVKIDSLPVPLFFEKFTRRGNSGALVVFEDMDTRARAAELVGREFYVEKPEAEREDGEFYMEDLIGFKACFDGGLTGRITDFLDNGTNPLLEVEVAGHRALIPAVDEFVTRIDADVSQVCFELPDGLLDLND